MFALSACSSAPETKASARWENETHIFKITKADLSGSSSGSTNIKYPTATYETDPSSKDELVPEDVGGTYTMSIVVDAASNLATLTTVQQLYCQYSESALESVGVDLRNDNWAKFVVTDSPIEAKDGYVVLYSETKTETVFKNSASQTPVSSQNKCTGFYIGQSHIEVTDYDIATSYDWDNNKATVTGTRSDNGESKTVNSTVSLGSTSLIDANQILLYVRSLDKTSDKFQDSPSVSVFSAVSETSYTALFSSFTYSCDTYLTTTNVDSTEEDIPVTLNMVAVSVDGYILMVQLNLPETVNDDEASLDLLVNVTGESRDKYTTVRFRSGVINYDKTDISDEIIEAVRSDKSTETSE